MREMSKYTKFCLKADAIKEIGTNFDWRIESLKEDIDRYDNYIAERIAEHASDPDWKANEDWSIANWEENIAKCNIALEIYAKFSRILDKEMGE